MKLSKLQEQIVNTTEPHVVVLAAAAAGKTATLTERVRKLLRDGEEPSDIACITFTNLAAQEMRDRLGEDYKDGIYIGTIHGLANKFLVTHGIKTDSIRDNKEFDKFFTLIKKNPHCVKHIRHILLDEAQDTSSDEFNFIFNMIDPTTFFVVGDLRQSIYSFKGAEPELLEKLCEDPEVTTYSLNENYRNGRNILNYAKKILYRSGMSDDSIPMRDGGIVYETEPDFLNLKGWVTRKGDFKDWAVLCSTNDQVDFLVDNLEKADIPNTTFKQGDLTKAELEESMQSNCIKVLTRHSAKGLEFPYVAVWKPQWWGGKEAYRVNYVAATRARDVLLWMEQPRKKKRAKYF